MMGYINKLMNFMGIKKEDNGEINSFIIGNICFVIIDVYSCSFLVFNNISQAKEISRLFNVSLDEFCGNNISNILIKKMNKNNKSLKIIMS